MSSTSTTQYYGLTQYVGTDKPDFADNNVAFRDVDAALHGVVQDAEGFATDITNLQTDVAAAQSDITTLQTDLDTAEANIVTINNKDLAQDAEIARVDTNSKDMITAYNEASATSTHAYAIGDYFIYNNVLYKATAAIAIGDTIVPDTNCATTNVTSELIQLNSDLTKTPIDVTNLFSINNNLWWSAIYNPIARTVKLSCHGHGSFENGSILFTVPSKYAFNVPDLYVVGALGNARDTNNTYAFTIAKFRSANNTYQVEVDYSQGITAEEVSFSVEYGI